MAIVESVRVYEENLFNSLGISYDGLRLIELGNQEYNRKPAKLLYESKGTLHTSIDINGKDGALPLDLSVPVENPPTGDVLTNYGTTEHVENQYECFRNIHNMVNKRGIIIHGVPLVNNWINHGRYYFLPSFFISLANLCNYEIIEMQVLDKDFYKFPRNLVLTVFRKTKDNEFISKDLFCRIEGIHDSGDKRNTQNYTR